MKLIQPRYGWVPDRHDERDFLYAAPVPVLKTLPVSVDLRPQCPPVYDQGQIGSCTANSIAAVIEFDLLKQNLPDFVPSRLFIYYSERVMEDSVATDSGAQIRDGIKSVSKVGVCNEVTWPYDPPQLTTKPSDVAYLEALAHTAVEYQRVAQTAAQMKGCLADGYPFTFGFKVYSGFESEEVARTGMVPMPKWYQRSLGGHAVVAVGYDDTKGCFIGRNSWSAAWGMGGYFWIPYKYLLSPSLTSDLWTIRVVR
jgi:C1A family cysteine protease